jgi:hypothetical protein
MISENQPSTTISSLDLDFSMYKLSISVLIQSSLFTINNSSPQFIAILYRCLASAPDKEYNKSSSSSPEQAVSTE